MVLFEAAVSIMCILQKEFDALYVHYGQAVYACEILNSNIDNISGLSSQEGFGQLYGYAGEETFYRTDDRPSPHNCYTSADRLIEATKKTVLQPRV